jgi:ABC-type nickel/cobalt efflux system permease component RcnA
MSDVAADIEGLLDRARGHEHKLVRVQTAHAKVHGTSVLRRFNTKLAVWITVAVASMWCAYAFAVLAFVSLPAAIRTGDPVVLVSWVSQTFLQLVLLAIIMVGQQVLSAAADARAEADHETLQLLHELNVTQLQILQELRGTLQAPDPGTKSNTGS